MGNSAGGMGSWLAGDLYAVRIASCNCSQRSCRLQGFNIDPTSKYPVVSCFCVCHVSTPLFLLFCLAIQQPWLKDYLEMHLYSVNAIRYPDFRRERGLIDILGTRNMNYLFVCELTVLI